jgi:cyclic pyranopterin phosphate synthase
MLRGMERSSPSPESSAGGEFSHVDASGEVRMVDVSAKQVVPREAIATGRIVLERRTLEMIAEDRVAKGNVLATARIAGIQAAKRTAELIPLCHTLPLHHVGVDFHPAADGIEITATARTTATTGVEMEALTAVSVAALTLYDMCKAVDRNMRIEGVRLTSKKKG